MDFIDRIQALAIRIPKQLEFCSTEEATKNALVLPFINALGYDVFNPSEVVPEFTADIGTKKGEKVDYAIMKDGKPIILFECKWSGADLSREHMSQLYRYFAAVPEVRFGILTNGVAYRFYSDLDSPNRIDDKPFFEFNMLDFQDRHVEELKKFTKSVFDLEQILTTASELKYTAAIQRMIGQEFEQPSEDFVRYFAARVYSGRVTQSVREQFTEIVHKALRRFLNDSINERLQSAIESSKRVETATLASAPEPVAEAKVQEELSEGVVRQDSQRGIVTTEDEIEAYFVVKSILREVVDAKRVHMRDAKSYCSVLLDDSNRKPVCRFHFGRDQKYLGLFDGGSRDDRVPIGEIDDVYAYRERIIAVVQEYESGTGARSSVASPKATVSPGSSLTKNNAAGPTSYTGTKPTAYVFRGRRQVASTWREVMLGVLEEMRKADQKRFEQFAVTMVGRKRPYITADQARLRSAEPIPHTALYVETNLDAESIATLCQNLAQKMGYSVNDLSFELS